MLNHLESTVANVIVWEVFCSHLPMPQLSSQQSQSSSPDEFPLVCRSLSKCWSSPYQGLALCRRRTPVHTLQTWYLARTMSVERNSAMWINFRLNAKVVYFGGKVAHLVIITHFYHQHPFCYSHFFGGIWLQFHPFPPLLPSPPSHHVIIT